MQRTLLLLAALLLTAAVATAGQLVEGIVYLRDGTTVEFTGRDRIRLPRGRRGLKIVRNAFDKKTRTKETIPFERIDSIRSWAPYAPQHSRKFLPTASQGWMWVYFETPHLQACVYSKKGYDIDAKGGIRFRQRRRFLSRSRVAFYLRKRGDAEWFCAGPTDRNPTDAFRKRLARYAADDPALADRIRRSSSIRGKTLRMLQDYNPQKTR